MAIAPDTKTARRMDLGASSRCWLCHFRRVGQCLAGKWWSARI